MKKYKTLCDITMDDKDTLKMKVLPKGSILVEAMDGGMFECKKPVMCIGVNWIKNNPHVFKKI